MRSDAGSWPECAPPPWLARASGLETAAPRRSTLADGATAARWPSPNTQRWPRCTRATTGEKAPVTLDRRLRQPRASNGCCTSNAKASGGGDPGNAPLGLSASAGGVPAGTSRAGPPGAAAATAAAAFSRDTTSAACGASSWESTNKARSSDCHAARFSEIHARDAASCRSVSPRRSLSHSQASASAREAVSGSARPAEGSMRDRATRVCATTHERWSAAATSGPSRVGGGNSGSTFQLTGSARDQMLKKAAHQGRRTGSPPATGGGGRRQSGHAPECGGRDSHGCLQVSGHVGVRKDACRTVQVQYAGGRPSMRAGGRRCVWHACACVCKARTARALVPPPRDEEHGGGRATGEEAIDGEGQPGVGDAPDCAAGLQGAQTGGGVVQWRKACRESRRGVQWRCGPVRGGAIWRCRPLGARAEESVTRHNSHPPPLSPLCQAG
eukprot:scaffold25503_cov90-Isochrysis_galbana.AAC.1